MINYKNLISFYKKYDSSICLAAIAITFYFNPYIYVSLIFSAIFYKFIFETDIKYSITFESKNLNKVEEDDECDEEDDECEDDECYEKDEDKNEDKNEDDDKSCVEEKKIVEEIVKNSPEETYESIFS